MDRKAYNILQRDTKKQLDGAIKRFAEQNPEKFAELQTRAKHELEHPPERTIIRHLMPSHKGRIDIDTLVMRFRAGRKHCYIHTTDCWKEEHLYSELLQSPEEATGVLAQRHSKFTERREKVTKVEQCTCPLCS